MVYTTKLLKYTLVILLLSVLGHFNSFGNNYVVTKSTGNENWVSTANDGSFGGAIKAVNAQPAGTSHTITFNIPGTGPFILDISQMNYTENVNNTVFINGLSQPGATCSALQIVLNKGGGNLNFNNQVNGGLQGLVIQSTAITYSGGSGNTIYSCYFNLDATGTASSGGLAVGSGIDLNILNSSNCIVGGTTCAKRNIFSGSNATMAVQVSGSNGTKVVGNYIGTNATGDALIGSLGQYGIYVTNSNSVSLDSNTVDGSTGPGIYTFSGPTNNLNIRGNFLGLKPDGTVPATDLGNKKAGIYLNASATTVLIDNNISCFNGTTNLADNSGIYIAAVSGTAYSGVTVSNNYIGVTKTFAKAGNYFAGLYLEGTGGGTMASMTVSGNIIGDNGNNPTQKSSGIATLNITNAGLSIYGNYIGMTTAGADIGNYHNGIEIFNTSGVTIGGTGVNQRNYIGYNKALRPRAGDPLAAAIFLVGSTTSGITIKNNYIGVRPDGVTAAPNLTAGASTSENCGIIAEGAQNVTIGGTTAAEGNIIANSSKHGILIYKSADLVQVRRNSIFCNGEMGISLNLASVITGGPGNTSFAAPVIDNSSITANTVSGTCPSGTTTVEVFYEDDICTRACTDANKLEGKVFLGYATVTGTTWTYTNGSNFTAGRELTATATGGGRTSEFSTCASLCTTPTISGTNTACANQTGLTFSTAQNADWTITGNGTITSSASGVKSITVTAGASGTFTLVAAVGSCTSSNFVVTINPNPTGSASATSPSICAGQSTAITVTPSGGTAPYTYSWTPTASLSAGNIQSPTATPAGTTTYSVVVTDNKGCSNSASPATVTVTVNPKPTASASATSPTICAGQSTAITVTPSGGTAPYTYSWTPTASLSAGNVQSPTATPAGTTTYSVVVTDNKGCSNSASPATVTVTVNPNPTASASATSPTICAGQSTAITVAPSGGTAPYTYSWTPTASLSAGNVQSPTATPAGTTTYSVVVTDNKGCSNSASPATVTVTVNPNPTASASATSPTICAGQSTAITVTPSGGTAPYTYSWTPTASLSAGNVQSPTATPAGTTTYSVVVTDNKGCSNSASPATVTVTVNPKPTASASATSPTICAGQSTAITVTPSGGTTPYTYSWTPTASLSAGNVQSPTATPAGTTTYSVVVTDNKGCSNSASPATVTVTVNPNPTASASATSPTICAGQSTAITVTPSGGTAPYTYSWTPTASLSAGNIQSPTATPAGTTTYSVVVTDNKGCSNSASPATVTVTVNPTPTASASATSPTICAGQSTAITVTPSGGTTPYTYSWTPIASLSAGNIQSPTATPAGTTTYSVVVTDNKGCSNSASPATVTVTVNPKPTASASATSPSICSGQSTAITVTPSGGTAPYTYSWTPTASLSAGNIQSPTATPAGTTTYSVVVTDNKGCSNSASPATVTVTVNPTLLASASATSPSICAGQSTAITVTPGNGTAPYTYSWTPTATLSAGNVQSPTATPAGTTTYSVVVTDNKGCSNSASPATVTVTVNSLPTPTVTADKTIFCQGLSANLATSQSYSSYAWTPGNLNSATITASTTGTYSVLVTDANGCQGTGTIGITVNANPVISSVSASPNSICAGGSTTLSVSATGTGTISYSWSPNTGLASTNGSSVTATLSTVGTTNYTVLVTNGDNSCSVTSSIISVEVKDKPLITSSPSVSVCSGTALDYTIKSDINSTFTWDRAAVTGIDNPAATGSTNNPITETLLNTTDQPVVVSYSITANSGSCGSGLFNLDVTVNPLPTVDAISADSTGICGSTSVGLNVKLIGNPTDIRYLWTPGSTLDNDTISNPKATPLVTTLYSVLVTDTLTGCHNNPLVDTIRIKVLPNVSTPDLGPDFSICLTEWQINGNVLNIGKGNWSVLSGGAKLDSTVSDTAAFFSGLSLGVNKFLYTVTGTCPKGGLTDTLTITVIPSDLHVAVNAPKDTLCATTSIDIGTTLSGTIEKPLTYFWSSASGSDSVSYFPKDKDDVLNLASQNVGWTKYYVVVMDGKGCMSNMGRDSSFSVGPQKLVIPNLITPNGDEWNNCWKIKDVNEIDIIPGAQLNIYNRWGQAVYLNKHYKNGDFCGSILADGIYFYEVQPVCGKEEQKGWLHIISNTDESNNK